MTSLLNSPLPTSLAINVVADDGQLVHARVDGQLAHRFPCTLSLPPSVAECSVISVTDSKGSHPPVGCEGLDSLTSPPSYDEPLACTIGADAYQRRVLLNLSAVTGMDTSGVNWLLTVQKRIDAAGGRLVLHSLSQAARNMVRVLNLHGTLRVAINETDAIQSL